MTQNEINAKVFKDSGKGFQRTRTLVAKYGQEAAFSALSYCGERGGRMRVYGKEAGGIGPAR